jgi:type VI protein secretion system component Hcp
MEKIMSKTKDTSNLATLEDHRPLADSELDAVTGGAVPKLYEAACKGTHLPEVTHPALVNPGAR